MRPIKKLIWMSAQMAGQISLSMKSNFVRPLAHNVKLVIRLSLTQVPFLCLSVLPLLKHCRGTILYY